jgi:hypothetical protein
MRSHFVMWRCVQVQGFELKLLRGARKLLAAQRIACIAFELATDWLRGQNTSGAELWKAFARHDYVILDDNFQAVPERVMASLEGVWDFVACARGVARTAFPCRDPLKATALSTASAGAMQQLGCQKHASKLHRRAQRCVDTRSSHAKGAIRCCSDPSETRDGALSHGTQGKCFSVCPEDPRHAPGAAELRPLSCIPAYSSSSHAFYSHAQAVGECRAHGMRLCTSAELSSELCCKTGCRTDNKMIWTSSTCNGDFDERNDDPDPADFALG